MNEPLWCQGRLLTPSQLEWLQHWVAAHPSWSRYQLACELCRQWQWQNHRGHWKTFAARSLLLKLEARGVVRLPPLRHAFRRQIGNWQVPTVTATAPPVTPIAGDLATLRPRVIQADAAGVECQRRVYTYVTHYHYLGLRRLVGETLGYLVTDQEGRELACLLFGAAAWRVAARDQCLGWDEEQRRRDLPLLTQQTRFLILPGVRAPNLASWVLATVLRRLSDDWQQKYRHPIILVETFVERRRFTGCIYRAGNWYYAGHTTGRGRQDRQHRLHLGGKDVYLYPLSRALRRARRTWPVVVSPVRGDGAGGPQNE